MMERGASRCGNAYLFTLKDVLVDFDRLRVDHVEVGVEALGEPLGQFFLDGHGLVRIRVDRALELLQAVRQVGPLTGPLERRQVLRQLVREALGIYLN